MQTVVRAGGCPGVAVHASGTAPPTSRRLPWPGISHRIHRTSGRHRRGLTSTVTADPKPRRARVAATVIVRTPTPVPARPAATGCGAVSARATPGSMRPTRFKRRREVRPGSGQRAADVILAEPFELPEQLFAHLTQAAMQAGLGVCVPGLLERPRAGQDIPALHRRQRGSVLMSNSLPSGSCIPTA